MIVGVTVGTEKIIEALRRKEAAYIIVVLDEEHRGEPYLIDGIKYYGKRDADRIFGGQPGIIYHFYKNRMMLSDISHYDFDK